MANPAVKNGYFPFANELAEKLATVALNGSEWRIIMVVLRQTWGWQDGSRRKDWDRISLSQFVEKTGMKRSNVAQTLKQLVVKRVLDKEVSGKKRYRFNQNYDQWVVVKRLPSSQMTTGKGSHLTPKSSSHLTTHNIKKETFKESITAAPESSSEIQPPPFDQDLAIENLAHAKNRVHVIAGFLMASKGKKYDNQEQFNWGFKRALQAAKQLEPFNGDQIREAVRLTVLQGDELGFDWTPQTVLKNIERALESVEEVDYDKLEPEQQRDITLQMMEEQIQEQQGENDV